MLVDCWKTGVVQEIDMGNKHVAWGRWLRVQVSSPMKQGCWLALPGGKKIWFDFRFDKMPNFCYICGCLDHNERDYDKELELKSANCGVSKAYGP